MIRLVSWTNSIMKFAGLSEKVGYLQQTFGKKLLARLAQSYTVEPGQDGVWTVLHTLSMSDPTGERCRDPKFRGKYLYLEWMVRRFCEGEVRMSKDLSVFEDADKMGSLHHHFANMNLLPPINNYKSVAELSADVNPKNVSKMADAELLKRAEKLGAKTILEEDGLKVVEVAYRPPEGYVTPDLPPPIVKSEGQAETELEREARVNPHLRNACKAAREIGSNTDWCTTSIHMAAQYLKEAPLYVVYEDGVKLGQLHLPSSQFMNVYDAPIKFDYSDDVDEEDDPDDAEKFPRMASRTEKWLRDFLSKSPSGIAMRAQMKDVVPFSEEQLELVKTDPEAAITFALAGKYRGGPKIGIESVRMSNDPAMASRLAVGLKRPIHEIEDIILRDVKATANYVSSLLSMVHDEHVSSRNNLPFSSDPVLEQRAKLALEANGDKKLMAKSAWMFSKPWEAGAAALAVIDRSWDTEYILKYAQKFGDSQSTRVAMLNAIQEDAIGNGPIYLSTYLKTVPMSGAWPEVEPILSQDPSGKSMGLYSLAVGAGSEADVPEYLKSWFPQNFRSKYQSNAMPPRNKNRSPVVEQWLMAKGSYADVATYLSSIVQPWPEGVHHLATLRDTTYEYRVPYLTKLPDGDPHRSALHSETGEMYDPTHPTKKATSWVRTNTKIS